MKKIEKIKKIIKSTNGNKAFQKYDLIPAMLDRDSYVIGYEDCRLDILKELQ